MLTDRSSEETGLSDPGGFFVVRKTLSAEKNLKIFQKSRDILGCSALVEGEETKEE